VGKKIKKTESNWWTEPNKKNWTITNSSKTELKQFGSILFGLKQFASTLPSKIW